LVLVTIVAISGEAMADLESDSGVWGVVTASGTAEAISPKLEDIRWSLEAQARFRDDAGDFDQSIVRPGIGYAISDELTVWLGYGWFRISPEGGSDFDEHRIWQQLSWSRNFDPVRLTTRTRFEQRFREDGDDTGGRFRQKIRVDHPLSSQFDLVIHDEVFVNLNSTDWGARSGFNQNRGFAGFRWNANPHVRLEIGYLNRFTHRSGKRDAIDHIALITLQLSP
jgi:hypothetical protein